VAQECLEDSTEDPEAERRDERVPERRWTHWLPSIFIALALVTGVSGTAYWLLNAPSSNAVEIYLANPTPQTDPVVHIVGAVSSPGVYTLESDSRVADAIAAAGGGVPGANIVALNLAQRVTDGQRIDVPRLNSAEGGANSGGAISGETANTTGLIDLNNASQSELETLPNIGPERAKSIIEWRNTNGSFESLDSLRDIPGIGPETVSGIRGLAVPE
jgi:comEA protein